MHPSRSFNNQSSSRPSNPLSTSQDPQNQSYQLYPLHPGQHAAVPPPSAPPLYSTETTTIISSLPRSSTQPSFPVYSNPSQAGPAVDGSNSAFVVYGGLFVSPIPTTNFYLTNQLTASIPALSTLPVTRHEPSALPAHATSSTVYAPNCIPACNEEIAKNININNRSNPMGSSRQHTLLPTPISTSQLSASRPQGRYQNLSHTQSESATHAASRDNAHLIQQSLQSGQVDYNSRHSSALDTVTVPNAGGITTLDLTNEVHFSKGDPGSNGSAHIERVKTLKPNSVPFEYRTPSRSSLVADSTSSVVAQRLAPSSHSRLSSSSQRRANVPTSSYHSNSSTPYIKSQSAVSPRASPTPPLQSSVPSTAERITAPKKRRYATPKQSFPPANSSSGPRSKHALHTQAVSRSYFKPRSQTTGGAAGASKAIVTRPPLPHHDHLNQGSYSNLHSVKSVRQSALLLPAPLGSKTTSQQAIASASAKAALSDSTVLPNRSLRKESTLPEAPSSVDLSGNLENDPKKIQVQLTDCETNLSEKNPPKSVNPQKKIGTSLCPRSASASSGGAGIPNRSQTNFCVKTTVPSEDVPSQKSFRDTHIHFCAESKIALTSKSCVFQSATYSSCAPKATNGSPPAASISIQKKSMSGAHSSDATLAEGALKPTSQHTALLELTPVSNTELHRAQEASDSKIDLRLAARSMSGSSCTEPGKCVQQLPLASGQNGSQATYSPDQINGAGNSQEQLKPTLRKRRLLKRKRAVLDEFGDDDASSVLCTQKKAKEVHFTTPLRAVSGSKDTSVHIRAEPENSTVTEKQPVFDPQKSETVQNRNPKSEDCEQVLPSIDAPYPIATCRKAGDLSTPTADTMEPVCNNSNTDKAVRENQRKTLARTSCPVGHPSVGTHTHRIPIRLPLRRSAIRKRIVADKEEICLSHKQKSSSAALRSGKNSFAINPKNIFEGVESKESAPIDVTNSCSVEGPEDKDESDALSAPDKLAISQQEKNDQTIDKLENKRKRRVQDMGRAEKRRRVKASNRYKIPLVLRIKSSETVPRPCLAPQPNQADKRRRVVRFADGVQPSPLPQRTESACSSEEFKKAPSLMPSKELRIVQTRLSRCEAAAFNLASTPVLCDSVRPSPRVSYTRCCLCGEKLVNGVSHPLFDVRFMRICKDCREIVLRKLMLTSEVEHLSAPETDYDLNGKKADFFVAVIETMILTYRRSERELRQVSLAYKALVGRPRQYVIDRMKRLFVCYEMVPIACALLSRIGVQIRRGKVSWPMDGFRMAPHDAVDIVRSAWPQTMEHLREGVFPSDVAWSKHCPDAKLDEEPWSCTVIIHVLNLIGVKVSHKLKCEHANNEDGQCFVEVELASVLGALLRGGGWATDHEVTALFAHNWAYKEVLFSLRGEDLEKAGHQIPEKLLPSGCCICGNEHNRKYYPLRFAECKTCKRRFCSPCLTNVLGGNDYVTAFRDDSYQCALCRLGSNQAVFPRGEANISRMNQHTVPPAEGSTSVEVIELDPCDQENTVTPDQNCSNLHTPKRKAFGQSEANLEKGDKEPLRLPIRKPISSIMKVSGRVTHSRSAKSAVPPMMKLSFARRKDLLKHDGCNGMLHLKAVGFAKICEAGNDRVLNGGKAVERHDSEFICMICKLPGSYVEERLAAEEEEEEIVEVGVAPDSGVVHCGVSQCWNVVHKRCMTERDRSHLTAENGRRRKGAKTKWRCGHHYCSVCDGKDDNKMLKCRTCPNSFCRDHVPSINTLSLFTERLMTCADCEPHIAPPKRAWSTDLRKSNGRRRSSSTISLGLAIMGAQQRGELKNFVENK